MGYMSLQEVKDYLSMPARVVEKLDIHRCKQGFAKEVVEDFAQRHRLPRPVDTDIIAVGDPPNDWVSADSWGKALWWADNMTLAIVGHQPPEWVVDAVADDNPRPLVAAIEGEYGDMFASDWQHAVELLSSLEET